VQAFAASSAIGIVKVRSARLIIVNGGSKSSSTLACSRGDAALDAVVSFGWVRRRARAAAAHRAFEDHDDDVYVSRSVRCDLVDGLRFGAAA